MKKALFFVFFASFLILSGVGFISAGLCRGYDGYYHDCDSYNVGFRDGYDKGYEKGYRYGYDEGVKDYSRNVKVYSGNIRVDCKKDDSYLRYKDTSITYKSTHCQADYWGRCNYEYIRNYYYGQGYKNDY